MRQNWYVLNALIGLTHVAGLSIARSCHVRVEFREEKLGYKLPGYVTTRGMPYFVNVGNSLITPCFIPKSPGSF